MAASDSTPLPISFSPLNSMDGQAGAPGKLGLRQSEECPSGAQLSGGDHSLLHQGPASADRRYQPCVAEATRQGAGRTWSGVADARACRQACPMPFAPGVEVPKHRVQNSPDHVRRILNGCQSSRRGQDGHHHQCRCDPAVCSSNPVTSLWHWSIQALTIVPRRQTQACDENNPDRGSAGTSDQLKEMQASVGHLAYSTG